MKSNILPKPIEEQIKKLLFAIFEREYPARSEQIIAALVNRELDTIKTARLDSAIKTPIQKFIVADVAGPLHDLGAENMRLEIFNTDVGKAYALVFETNEQTTETDYDKYCQALDKGRFYPDPRD